MGALLLQLLNLFFCSLVLLACASNETESTNKKYKSIPEWVYSVSSACVEAKELCASGEGTSLNESDSDAKSSLASIFQTQISSDFEIDKSVVSKEESTKIEENVKSQVKQKVNELLVGSTIKERAEKDGVYYSLASIDRSKTGQILRAQILELDEILLQQFNLKNKLYVPKMLESLRKRNELADRLFIVTNQQLKSPISYNQIKKLKFNENANYTVSVSRGANTPKFLLNKVKDSLTALNYKITKPESADFKIVLRFSQRDEHLNVSGFIKMTFTLNLDSINQNGDKIGGDLIQVTTQGRSKEDCFNKMKQKIAKRIDKNIEKLNLKN